MTIQREPMSSDREGQVLIEKLRAGEYGVWVVASGYCPKWVAPVEARATTANAPPATIKLQPAGTLVLKATPGLLDGIDHPYLAYRIADSEGRAVFPGGEAQDNGPVETGLAPIGAGDEGAYRVDVLPAGDYTLTWEVRPARPIRRHAHPTPPPVCSGSARFAIRVGEETSVVLSPDAPAA